MSGGSNHVAATAPHANPNFARAGGAAGRVMLSPTEPLGATYQDTPTTGRALTMTPVGAATAEHFMDSKDIRVLNDIIDDLNRFDADNEELDTSSPMDKLPEEQVSFVLFNYLCGEREFYLFVALTVNNVGTRRKHMLNVYVLIKAPN